MVDLLDDHVSPLAEQDSGDIPKRSTTLRWLIFAGTNVWYFFGFGQNRKI